jgi:aminoglycoside 3-N-acetyltransferase
MKKFKIVELLDSLSTLELIKGDLLLVHSSLYNFGIPTDCSISEVPSKIFNALQTRIGAEGTIAVPTFNFDFCKGVPFNIQETPSKNMGVFSEFVRKYPKAKRSKHPMQSIAVVGSKTDIIIENDTESSFSPDGPFDRLNALNGKILLLGADFNSVSMIHWVEEKYKVPYRYWKTFKGTYIDNNISSEKSYKMYVRSMESNPLLKLYSIEKELIKMNKLLEIQIGSGSIKVFDISDFISIAEGFISRNPYYFVSNHPDFEKL